MKDFLLTSLFACLAACAVMLPSLHLAASAHAATQARQAADPRPVPPVPTFDEDDAPRPASPLPAGPIDTNID